MYDIQFTHYVTCVVIIVITDIEMVLYDMHAAILEEHSKMYSYVQGLWKVYFRFCLLTFSLSKLPYPGG